MSTDAKGRLFERMTDAVGWTGRSLAEEVEELEDGWSIRTPSFPQVWSLNHLFLRSVSSPKTSLSLANRLQEGLSFRHVQVVQQAKSLDEGAFARAGWRVDREVYMVLAGVPPRADVTGVCSLGPAEVTRLMGEWIEEDHPGIPAASRAQIEQASQLEGKLWDERAFGILDDQGNPVAVTKLRIGHGVAWVEDVFTSVSARRLGHARRLVTHAVSRAANSDADFTFIVADDNDWPKHLYASIGFEAVGRTWTLHRETA